MTAAEHCKCIAVLDFQFSRSHLVNEKEEARKTERESTFDSAGQCDRIVEIKCIENNTTFLVQKLWNAV